MTDVTLDLNYDCGGKGGTATLTVDGKKVASETLHEEGTCRCRQVRLGCVAPSHELDSRRRLNWQ